MLFRGLCFGRERAHTRTMQRKAEAWKIHNENNEWKYAILQNGPCLTALPQPFIKHASAPPVMHRKRATKGNAGHLASMRLPNSKHKSCSVSRINQPCKTPRNQPVSLWACEPIGSYIIRKNHTRFLYGISGQHATKILFEATWQLSQQQPWIRWIHCSVVLRCAKRHQEHVAWPSRELVATADKDQDHWKKCHLGTELRNYDNLQQPIAPLLVTTILINLVTSADILQK